MIRLSTLVVAGLLMAAPGHAQDSATREARPDAQLSAALLAAEEARLRERMMTALSIADGVRLRGRTLLVAILEINRLTRTLMDLTPLDPDRPAFEQRLYDLEQRRREVSDLLDDDFLSYVALVGELSNDLATRVRRVGAQLGADLQDRGLERLRDLLPHLRRHIRSMELAGELSAVEATRWRVEIDDTYLERRDRLEDRSRRRRAPSADHADERDI